MTTVNSLLDTQTFAPLYDVFLEEANIKICSRNLKIFQARVRYDPSSDSLVTVGVESSDDVITTTTAPAPVPLDKLLSHVGHYETQIVSQLRNAVVETGRAVRNGEVKNAYDVEYEGTLSLAMQPKVGGENEVLIVKQK